jgi:hypothetical protein
MGAQMITGGRTQARDEILTVVNDAVGGLGHTVVWQDELVDVDVNEVVLGVAVQHIAGDQAALAGGLGQRRWQTHGILTVEIRCPVKQGGLTLADDLATIMVDALRGKSTPNGVWFREVVGREVPPKDGNSRTTVSAEFVYQEIG